MKKAIGNVCAILLLAGFARDGFAEPTYDRTSQPGTLIVTVEADNATLDAAQVTADITNIVKEGPGRLTTVALETYTGDFTVNAGDLLVAQRYGLGADDAGTVTINDGASIVDGTIGYLWGDSISKGKTFVFNGAPAEGAVAKFYRSQGGGNAYFASSSTFKFLTDAAIDIYNQRIKLGGVLDLGGKTLTLFNSHNDGNPQTQIDCLMTNGHLVARGYVNHYDPDDFTLQNENGYFGFEPCEEPCSLTLTNAAYTIHWSCRANGATLRLIDGYFRSDPHGLKSDTTSSRWDGPVHLERRSALANNTWHTNVLTLAGNVSGTGELTVGPGWLNLSGAAENTYAGEVTVVADTTGIIATEHSGIALLDDSPFFPSAASVTFKDGANLALCNDYAQALPKLTFCGAGTATLTGGDRSDFGKSRPALAGLVKTDDGVLEIPAQVHATGPVTVKGGTLRLASKIYGRAGLWEWTCADMSGGETSNQQEAWGNDANDFKMRYIDTNAVQAVYSRAGAVKIFSGFEHIISNGLRRATGVVYQGYLWNRSNEPVTWQLALHQPYRGFFKVNDQYGCIRGQLGVNEKGELLTSEATTANIMTTTLQPGANPILIYSLLPNWELSSTPSLRFDGLRLSYDPNPVAGQTNVNNFVRLDDGGTGRLFTIDADDSSAAAADLLPVFDDLAFAPGTTFDLNGNAFVQGRLAGCPRVANGDLTIAAAWSLAGAEIAAGAKLEVDGALAFGEGAVVTSADESALRGREYVIATAASVTGRPVVDGNTALAGWRVRTTETTVSLVNCKGFKLVVR